MKTDIHPEYQDARIVCACGRVTETRATTEELHVEICSHCHPFFTGQQKLVDTAGRVERFLSKYGREEEAEELKAEAEERAEESEKMEMPEDMEAEEEPESVEETEASAEVPESGGEEAGAEGASAEADREAGGRAE